MQQDFEEIQYNSMGYKYLLVVNYQCLLHSQVIAVLQASIEFMDLKLLSAVEPMHVVHMPECKLISGHVVSHHSISTTYKPQSNGHSLSCAPLKR